MKKFISLFLTVIIFVSTITFAIKKLLIAKAEQTQLHSFVNDTSELIRTNDVGKEFVIENEYDSSTFTAHSAETENYDFQTCRLIVQADKEIDKLNSIGIASGFEDFYIVQFASVTDAIKAFNHYSQCDYVISVSPDMVFKADESFTEVGNGYVEYTENIPKRLDSWGGITSGTYAVLDYIEEKYEVENLPEIRVAVLDSGVDFYHEFFRDRLIITGYNVSAGGTENSEYDVQGEHGTCVTGTIIDNSPKNVKVANYKISYKGQTTTTAMASAIIKAATDGAKFINISMGKLFSSDAEYNLIDSALKSAYDMDSMVIVSAGNDGYDSNAARAIPSSCDSAFTVAASDKRNFPASFTNAGKCVNIMAPGVKYPVTYPNNKYKISSGTSFSSPLVLACATILKTLDSNLTKQDIKVKLESTAVKCDLMGNVEMYGYGIVDVIGAGGFERAEEPKINIADGVYIDEKEIKLTVPDGCEVYYSLDQIHPTPENSTLYTEPFKLSDDYYVVHAVAYKDGVFPSRMLSSQFGLTTLGTDDMFEIDKNGVITAYTGTIKCLSIPGSINGTEVKGLAEGLFKETDIFAVHFPDSVKTLPKELFRNNDNVVFVRGKGVTKIEESVFKDCNNLYYIEFPNVESIETNAFRFTRQLVGVDFPKCTYINEGAFYFSSIRSVNLPSAKIICFEAFRDCYNLTEINIPNVTELRKDSLINGIWQGSGSHFRDAMLAEPMNFEKLDELPYGTFYKAYVPRLDFSNVKIIGTLPITFCRFNFNSYMTAVLPASLRSCDLDIIPYDEQEDDIEYIFRYRIYGTKGTYAEQWAKDNGFDFIEISQKTAVIKDLPAEYYSYMRPLEADIVGFNKTYQWYGSDTKSYNNAIKIARATNKEFSPEDYAREFKYYFCIVTSTDTGCKPIEIKTGICENKTYKPYSPPTSNGKITIAAPSNRYLKYGESINLYANATGLPEGAKIKWRIVEGNGVELDPSVSGKTCTVTSKSNGDVIIEAYAVNKYGNAIINEKGIRIYDREAISSEVSLWEIILYLIRQVFGITKTAVNIIS